MKYKKGDKVRFIKTNDLMDSFTYGEVYTVREDSRHAHHVEVEEDDDGVENGWHTQYFEPAKLGEVQKPDTLLMFETEDLSVLRSLVRNELTELQNSLWEISGEQKNKCLESMIKLNKLLEKLGK